MLIMKIDSYRFGQIIIDGKAYDYDVVLVGKEVRRWVRKESHHVLWEDVEGLLDLKPEVVIFGTGSMEVMKVPPEVVSRLQEQGIEVIVERTGRAVEVYNEISKDLPRQQAGKKVVAALHLTC